MLYELLAASGCFSIVTARHVVDADALFLGDGRPSTSGFAALRRLASLGLSNRDVEAVRVGPDTPEEYGFLLDRRHAGFTLTAGNAHVFRRLCEAIRSRDPERRLLLLKNPWDFGHADRIRRLIPGARFVFIHRNPLHVLSSTLRFIANWGTHPNAYLALLSDRYRSFAQSEFPLRAARWLCAHARGPLLNAILGYDAMQTRGYLRSRATLGPDAAIDVRYEDLCADANGTIGAILHGMGVSSAPINYAAMIGPSASRPAPEALARRARILRAFGKYAAAVGYDLQELLEAASRRDDPREAAP